MSSKCQGKIKRYGNEYLCTQRAVYAVRNNDTLAVLGTCRQHLAQVIDDMEAESVLVVTA